ncbi:MAG: type VI secretion system tip protein VgrG, partial [Bacteroidota bacterium]|nr:type VI secretion system tip protein VgrG [Bacteroidota bacterium]
MALITDITISIDSNRFDARIRHLNISQSINKHHQFSIEFELASVEGMLDHFLMDKSKDYVGSVIQISIKPVDFLKQHAELNFKGVITNISANRANRRNGDMLTIQGYSPDILIDETPNCKSFEEADIKQIFSEVLKPYPKNLLPLKSSPNSSEKFDYIVQYNETNFNFLYRLAALNGEWFFYDGQNLHLGLDTGKETELEYGSDLIDFNFSMGVSPINFSFSAFSYSDVKTYSSSSKSASISGLNDNQKVSEKKSEGLYTSDNNQFLIHHSSNINQSSLDKIVKKVKGNKISNAVVCSGQSENTGVQIGQIISISGKNMIMETGPNYGQYLVVSVNHSSDLEGNYMNTFTAIPANITNNPFIVPQLFPRIESQSAVVTDNSDPDKLGRIRVRFYWQEQKDSPWLRIVNPYAGDKRGAFIIPEIGDEVMVQFEGSNAEKPYVIG